MRNLIPRPGSCPKVLVTFISLLAAASLLAACDSQAPTPTPIAPQATATAAGLIPVANTPPLAETPTEVSEANPTPTSAESPTAVSESNPTPAATDTVAALSITPAGSSNQTPGSSDAAAALAQGIDAYNKANYDGAITAFTQAIQASSQFGTAYIDRAVAYFAKGDFKNAVPDLDQARSLQPNDSYPFLVYGLVYFAQGDFNNAQAQFSNLIDADPSDPTGYFWRANADIQLKDSGSASDDFTQVVRLSPNSELGKQAQAALDQINAGGEVTVAQLPQLTTVQGEPPPPSSASETVGQGQLVADLTFRPQTDGFKFENYGGEPDRSEMTADDVRRMFGDQVCASLANGCILTPEAQQWLDATNKDAAGGHCEGFAALSLALFEHKENAGQFGASTTHDLTIDGNTALQREIAYFWATQTVRPVSDSLISDKTPSQILDILIDAFKQGASAPRTYTMGIFKPGFKDGHAITPYAVEDRGNGQFAVRVYDNNIPDTERVLLIDRNANTWSYVASTNPNEPDSLYKGDATTMTLAITPDDARYGKMICDFCPAAKGGKAGSGLDAPATQYNEVYLEGTAHLLITDAQGHRTGFVTDTQFVNEIPGVEFKPLTSANLWQDSAEPIYYVPTGIEFTLAVESTNPTTNTLSTVSMIGPGYDLSVQDLELEPNTTDTINFSSDGKTLVYKTPYSDSPDLVLGTTGTNADYSFDLRGVDLGNDGTVTAHLDTDKGQLVIDAKNNQEAGTYSLVMDRIDSQGEQVFGHNKIQLQAGDTAYLDYGQWNGNSAPLELQIDHGSDGTIDETTQLSDIH
jgi:tetratricopeptide (TPR) repeat protein